jgi:hypothetical protein
MSGFGRGDSSQGDKAQGGVDLSELTVEQLEAIVAGKKD